MSAAEAIEKEIKRELEELDNLEAEKKRLLAKVKDANTLEEQWEIVEKLLDILIKLIHSDELEKEIEGKRIALQAVQDKPGNPVKAIDEKIKEEMRDARRLGRKAQRLREKAWRDEKAGRHEEAETARERAQELGFQHDLELAKLRGKHIARRAVLSALSEEQEKGN